MHTNTALRVLLAFGSYTTGVLASPCRGYELVNLEVAVSKAQACVATVLNEHNRIRHNDPEVHQGSKELRKRYFGHLSEDHDRYVDDVFHRMQEQWSKTTWNCARPGTPEDDFCEYEDVGAFVRDANEVTFCPNQLRGRSLEARLLIHEMTHTPAVRGSRRIVDINYTKAGACYQVPSILGFEHGAYGNFRAQQLAFWSSSAAVVNADNYALYAWQICLLLDHNSMFPPAEINLQPLPASCNVQSLPPSLVSTSDFHSRIFSLGVDDVLLIAQLTALLTALYIALMLVRVS